MAYVNITASTDIPLKEPEYHVNSGEFDTSLVRKQLNATKDGHRGREILTIAAKDINEVRDQIRHGVSMSSWRRPFWSSRLGVGLSTNPRLRSDPVLSGI